MSVKRAQQPYSLRSEGGIALVIALISVVVVAGIGLLMFTRTMNEIRHSADDARIVQTLMLARGGANAGAAVLVGDVINDIYEIVFETATPGRWSYGKDPSSNPQAGRPDPAEVAKDLVGVSRRLQERVDELVCDVDALGGLSGGEVQVRIFFSESACGDAVELPPRVTLPGGRFVDGEPRVEGIDIGIQEYAVPYVLVAEASVGDYRRNIVVQGEYVFSVGEAPFSYYAYFTNRESDDGGRIYFTTDTLIDGPVHTNGHFSFHTNPWFGGVVSTAGCEFNRNLTDYRNDCLLSPETRSPGGYLGSTFVPVDSMNPVNRPVRGSHAPEFSEGVSWHAQYVPMPSNAHHQESVALGTGRDDRGIHITGDLESLTLFAGNADGEEPQLVNGTWTPAATYQYITADTGSTTQQYTQYIRTEQEYVCSVRLPWWLGGTCVLGNWRTIGSTTTPSCERIRDDDFRVDCEPTTVTVVVPQLVRYRVNADQVLEMFNEDTEEWVAQSGTFNGVIYTTGKIDRLRGPDRPSGGNGLNTPPAIAAFAQITIASPADIRITSDLRYEQPPCSAQPYRDSRDVGQHATCENLNHPNVLGIYTSNGNIIVGNANTLDPTLNAPDDVHVHAVLMSGTKQIHVEKYQHGGNRGNFNLLGGMIQENRGVFGLVESKYGFHRVYTYDPRMREGVAPPFFPTTGLGEVQEVRYFSFGQREQIY